MKILALIGTLIAFSHSALAELYPLSADPRPIEIQIKALCGAFKKDVAYQLVVNKVHLAPAFSPYVWVVNKNHTIPAIAQSLAAPFNWVLIKSQMAEKMDDARVPEYRKWHFLPYFIPRAYSDILDYAFLDRVLNSKDCFASQPELVQSFKLDLQMRVARLNVYSLVALAVGVYLAGAPAAATSGAETVVASTGLRFAAQRVLAWAVPAKLYEKAGWLQRPGDLALESLKWLLRDSSKTAMISRWVTGGVLIQSFIAWYDSRMATDPHEWLIKEAQRGGGELTADQLEELLANAKNLNLSPYLVRDLKRKLFVNPIEAIRNGANLEDKDWIRLSLNLQKIQQDRDLGRDLLNESISYRISWEGALAARRISEGMSAQAGAY